MDLETLCALLDVDTPEDLVYFEEFAELMETPQDIPIETLIELVERMDEGVLSELTEGYFEDLMNYVPDHESELYTLLSNIGTTLTSLADRSGTESQIFAEELYKFRSWYLFDSRVFCTDRAEGMEREIPLREALTNYRVQNFTDDDYEFDFSEALDYPIDEYIVSLAALSETDDDSGYEDGDDEDFDYDETDEDEDEK